jgi:mRNA interferase YafQ
VKRAEKRGKDMDKLKTALLLLIEVRPRPPEYGDHPLKGDWKGFRDLHIEPDWLLLYRIEGAELQLARTGSHMRIFSRIEPAPDAGNGQALRRRDARPAVRRGQGGRVRLFGYKITWPGLSRPWSS